MTKLLGAIFALVALPLLLAACSGGLPHSGAVAVKAVTIGLHAGLDPATGSVDATIGYKSGTLAYVPNSTAPVGEDGVEGQELITANDGEDMDGRAMLIYDKAEVAAQSDDGVGSSFGSGVVFGHAARIVSKGMACNGGGSDPDFCVTN